MEDDIKEMMKQVEEDGGDLIIIYCDEGQLTKASVINSSIFKRLRETIWGYFYDC